MTDLRKEQLVLLRFEKQLAGLAALAAGAATVAHAADGKLGKEAAGDALAKVEAALMHLAEATGAAHSALDAAAIEAGARCLQATGGTPKREASQVVASILGIG